MRFFRLLRQSISRFPVRRAVAGPVLLAGGLLAAGALSSAVPAAPRDVCLPVLGCVTTTLPTVTVPTTVTLPITTTTTTTSTTNGGGTTTTTGTNGDSTGSTTSSTTTDTTAVPGAGLSVRISIRVRGHGAKRAIELRLRLSKPARVSALLSRQGKALKRNQFSARAGASVWRLRLGRTVKPGLAKLGLTYRSSAGEVARSNHRLRLPR
jgi:hypothetical protein